MNFSHYCMFNEQSMFVTHKQFSIKSHGHTSEILCYICKTSGINVGTNITRMCAKSTKQQPETLIPHKFISKCRKIAINPIKQNKVSIDDDNNFECWPSKVHSIKFDFLNKFYAKLLDTPPSTRILIRHESE